MKKEAKKSNSPKNTKKSNTPIDKKKANKNSKDFSAKPVNTQKNTGNSSNIL